MRKVLWVDSHFHPQIESLGFPSIKEAYEDGIIKLCCIAENVLLDNDFLMRCKNEYGTAIALGEHPMNDFSKTDWDFLEKMLPNYNAVGETGFDFQMDLKPQIEAFERQAFLAEKYNLPVVLHIRDSGDGKVEDLAIKEISKFQKLRGVFHCFVGTKKLADFALQKGFFLSFSGIVTFKKAEAIREVMKNLPIDRFLIETDAPFLAPVPKRGKLNHPMYVRYIGEFISRFLNLEEEEFSNLVLQNFDELYFS